MFKSHVWLHSDTVMRLVSQSHVSSVTQGSARSVTCSHYYYRDHAGWKYSGEWGQMSGWCLCDIHVYMAVCDLCMHICNVCLHISLYSDCSKKQPDLNDTSSRYDHFLACCHGYLLFMMGQVYLCKRTQLFLSIMMKMTYGTKGHSVQVLPKVFLH